VDGRRSRPQQHFAIAGSGPAARGGVQRARENAVTDTRPLGSCDGQCVLRRGRASPALRPVRGARPGGADSPRAVDDARSRRAHRSAESTTFLAGPGLVVPGVWGRFAGAAQNGARAEGLPIAGCDDSIGAAARLLPDRMGAPGFRNLKRVFRPITRMYAEPTVVVLVRTSMRWMKAPVGQRQSRRVSSLDDCAVAGLELAWGGDR